MLETYFRRFLFPDLEQHRKKTEDFTNRIVKLTNRIEQQMSDYDMLLNGVNTMIWLNHKPDVQGKSNKAVLDFFGVKAEDVEGKNLRDLMSPEEAEVCIKLNEEIFRTGKSKTTYEWVTRHDGEKRLLKINKNPKRNGVQYIVCSAEDVTELEKTKIELQNECNFTESVIQTAQALILVLDTNARIIRCNKYFEKVTGYSFEEIKDKNWFDTFINDSDRFELESYFISFLSGIDQENSFSQGMINSIKTKFGNNVIIEWFSQLLTDNDNTKIGVISVGQDITGKKNTEEELWSKIIELEMKLKEGSIENGGSLIKDRNKGTENILIVDDKESILKVLSHVLQQHGYSVIQASSVKDVEEYLQKNINIDLLITDFYLSDLNGFQLVTLVKEKKPEIDYLIISGFEPSLQEEILSHHFLQKPFLFDTFMNKVREILDNKKQMEIDQESSKIPDQI